MWKFEPDRIKMAREARDKTQAQLAMELGISAQQVSRWEAGEVLPGQENLTRICNVLTCPPKFFFVKGDDNSHQEA